jgi:hypothetical protein
MPKPTVFIGSSREGLDVARAVQSELDRDAACSVWNQGVFGPGSFILEILEQQAATRDFAILVLTPDVLQAARNDISYAPRSNILFELGLFMGRLGRKRVFAIQNREHPIERPSDLLGLSLLDYDSRENSDLQSAVGPACRYIREAIRAHGIKAATPLLVDRQNVYSEVGTIENRLASAQEEVRISGFDCKYVILDQHSAIEAALSRGVKVKIVCLDPTAESALGLLQKVPDHHPSGDNLRETIDKTKAMFCEWSKTYGESFEVRFLPILPVVGLFISDPEKEGLMKVELYTHEQRHGDVSRPHLIIPPSISAWRKYFLRQWDLYWKCSRIPQEEELSNSTHKKELLPVNNSSKSHGPKRFGPSRGMSGLLEPKAARSKPSGAASPQRP